MPRNFSQEQQTLNALPNVGVEEHADGVTTVKAFLARYGYLDATIRPEATAAETANVLDQDTSLALARYQAFQGLPPTGYSTRRPGR